MLRGIFKSLPLFGVSSLILYSLCGCTSMAGLGRGIERELYAPPKEEEMPESSRGSNFLFDIDPEWKMKHPECEERFGIVHFYDENGNRRCDPPDEVVEITPRGYPLHLINFLPPYQPR